MSTRDATSQLRIYSSASGAWVDVFNHADADDGDDLSVDVSDDGSRVALGCAASTLEVGGRVLVFTFASGAWTSAVVTPIETLTGTDLFGSAVAFANFGASLFVGARGVDGVATDTGKIYGFNLSVGSWVQNAAIEATGIAQDDLFGASLSISSDATTMVVGAPNKTTSATRAGDAYVFSYDGTVWSQALKIVPPSGSAGDLFGGAVAVSGSGRAIAIGALAMDGTQTDSGRVYHYQL